MSSPAPEYGPGGYLPERAARRARKIVLREQMGLGWPVAAVVAALLVAAAGFAHLRSSSTPPGPPFQSFGALDAVPPDGARTSGGPRPIVIVRAGGPVRAFSAPDATIGWCAASRRLEDDRGRVWTADGRLVGGDGASLRPLPTTVFDGEVYADDTTGLPRPAPDLRGESPRCG